MNATVQRSDAAGTPNFGIFNIAAGKNVTFGAFTIKNGTLTDGNGAGIYNQGTLTLKGTDVAGNETTGGNGGGIYNAGVLNLNNGARVDGNNQAVNGGGIYNAGTVNAVGRGLVQYDSTYQPTLTWQIPVIAADDATNGDGGGIYNAANGRLNLNLVEIFNNSATGNGGGIYNAANGNLTLRNSTLRNNQAPNGDGGGLYNAGSNAVINQNTFNQNSAGQQGGAIRNVGTGAKGNGNTINGNKVTGVPGVVSAGGGVSTTTAAGGSFSAVNNIIAQNTAPTNNDVDGVFTDLGHNFIGDGTGGNFVDGYNGDQVGTSSNPLNPLLGPLQDNGGGIETELPQAGSPVIDAGDNSQALPSDARGWTRIINNIIDLGAVEYNSSPASLSSATLNLSSSANPATPNQLVTLTATVSGQNGPPTGSVSFLSGSTLLGTAQLDGTGTATLSTSALSLGSQTLVAIYSGDGTYASTSSSLTQQVSQAGASTSISSSLNPAQPGQQVTFTATVSPSDGGTPTGSVTFFDGTTPLGSGTLALVNGQYQATYTTSSLASGNHAITAVYSGDDTYVASSGSMTETIGQSSATGSSTTVSDSTGMPQVGQNVTFTATVQGFGTTPTGSVTFFDGTTALSTVPLDGNGIATYTTSALSLGGHDIVAVYSGDSTYSGSAGSVTPSVVLGSSSTTLSASANPSPWGQAVTFTATVAASGFSSGTPTGTVAFYDGDTLLGIGTLSDVGGQMQATFSTSALEPGSHNIIAIYSGDSSFADSYSSLGESISS